MEWVFLPHVWCVLCLTTGFCEFDAGARDIIDNSIMTVSYVFLHFSSSVGRCAVRARSAVRCMGWRTATCGAPPAAGKRPARDSPTERSPPTSQCTTPTATAAFRQRKGQGASFCMHLVFFSSKSQLSVKRWLRHWRCPHPPSASLNASCGRNQRTAESSFTLPSRISSTASPFPVFGKPQGS